MKFRFIISLPFTRATDAWYNKVLGRGICGPLSLIQNIWMDEILQIEDLGSFVDRWYVISKIDYMLNHIQEKHSELRSKPNKNFL